MTNRLHDIQVLRTEASNTTDLNKQKVLYSRVLQQSPKNSFLYLTLALGLLSQKKYKEAKLKFKEAILFAPNNESLYSKWLEALYFHQQWSDVIVFIETFRHKFYPKHFLENSLGMCFLHLKDYDKAIECFKKAIEMGRDLKIAEMNWTLALYLQGKKEEAEGKFCEIWEKGVSKSEISCYENEILCLQEGLKRENIGTVFDEITMKIEAFSYILGLMKERSVCILNTFVGMP